MGPDEKKDAGLLSPLKNLHVFPSRKKREGMPIGNIPDNDEMLHVELLSIVETNYYREKEAIEYLSSD